MRFRSSNLRARTPTPALVISVIALIFAVAGSAFASGGSDNKKDKKIATAVANSVFTSRIGRITTAVATNSNGQIPPGSEGSAFVQCPAGSVVLSGGGSTPHQAFTRLSRKSDPNGWRYDAYNNSGVPTDITVFAYCVA